MNPTSRQNGGTAFPLNRHLPSQRWNSSYALACLFQIGERIMERLCTSCGRNCTNKIPRQLWGCSEESKRHEQSDETARLRGDLKSLEPKQKRTCLLSRLECAKRTKDLVQGIEEHESMSCIRATERSLPSPRLDSLYASLLVLFSFESFQENGLQRKYLSSLARRIEKSMLARLDAWDTA